MKRLSIVGVSSLFFLVIGCSNQTFKVEDQTQAFGQVQAYNNKIDLLLVMDTSSSMIQYRQRFSEQIPSFLNKLNQTQMDYQIGVTTMDLSSNGSGGQLIGSPKVLKQTTSNLVQLLQSRINFQTPGSADEMGLESMKRTLLKDGALLVRPESLLVVIFLTDENDISVDQKGLIDPKAFVTFLEGYKPPFATGIRAWVANLIGVHNSQELISCNATAVADRYFPLVSQSNGRLEPVCTGQMATTVENLRVQIFQLLTDYYLKKTPKEETIRVLVRGQLIPKDPVNGWQYDPQLKRIRFNGASVPGVFDSIQVDYTPIDAAG